MVALNPHHVWNQTLVFRQACAPVDNVRLQPQEGANRGAVCVR